MVGLASMAGDPLCTEICQQQTITSAPILVSKGVSNFILKRQKKLEVILVQVHQGGFKCLPGFTMLFQHFLHRYNLCLNQLRLC